LGSPELQSILEIQIRDLARRLERLGLGLEVSDLARKSLLEGVESSPYGARPLRRRLEQTVENEIANLLVSPVPPTGGTLKVDFKDGKFLIIGPGDSSGSTKESKGKA
jgi:ATP-dependent Clp protease ATP-binding subunit ClpA